MSKPDDFSPLEAIEFIFVDDKHQPEPVYKNCFGNTLELQAAKALFINDDPAKGIRPDSELLPALQLIVVDTLIAPNAQDTNKDVKTIHQLVAIAPLTVLNTKTDRMVRVNTRSTATAMRDTIATGVMGLGFRFFRFCAIDFKHACKTWFDNFPPKDVKTIHQLVAIAPLTVLNTKTNRMVRVNTRSTATAMRDTIATGVMGLGFSHIC
ncbi:unnamed protein product [Cylindrotheca closterium]|uniref:Uncharacterized protein n=1 Tax=Cylindrotheca closterium TaxID=2856 RepID=A0AAD2FJR1_9STRA|nr:unnamed protein product [Cylindrotheca closterium]